MKILVLSPHRDDAAFSLSISIRHWLTAGHQITIQNVFTRSLYAPFGSGEALPAEERLAFISEVRRAEDAAFLEAIGRGAEMGAGMGVRLMDLDLEDAPIRLRCDSSRVCELEVNDADAAIPKIQQAVQGFLDRHADAALVLPLGLGHHVDHRTVRDAALAFSPAVPCAFYEDLPYAMRPGVQIDLRRFREDTDHRLHEPLLPVLCRGTETRSVEWKKGLAMLYASQIDEPQAALIAAFSQRYQGGERLWANEKWIDAAFGEGLSERQRDPEAEPLPV